jgi:hypothetical protein
MALTELDDLMYNTLCQESIWHNADEKLIQMGFFADWRRQFEPPSGGFFSF